ncbi:MAG: hypothetical protein NTV93_03200 [Verrucomicrobia bacterium]|nr:hypothetical protein [Verrucomicrobiota bacterium]
MNSFPVCYISGRMTRAIPAAGLPFLTALVLSCFVAAAPAQQVAKTGTPSIIQIDFGPYGSHLPGDGQDYCYPTTATMLFFWLGANGYSQLAPGYTLSEGLNLDRVLGGLVQTSATGGTFNSNYMDGLDVYLKAKGVSAAQRTWATSGNPDIQWFADHNDANTVTLAGVSWYGRNGTSDNFTYEGGHHVSEHPRVARPIERKRILGHKPPVDICQRQFGRIHR